MMADDRFARYNVLLRWVNIRHASHTVAFEAVERLRSEGHSPAVAPQNLYELWVVSTRPKDVNGLGKSIEETRIEIDRLAPPLFHLLPDGPAILPIWLDLVTRYHVRGKPAHDARLVAAMLCHGVRDVVTFNVADFTRYTEIKAHSPKSIAAGEALRQ